MKQSLTIRSFTAFICDINLNLGSRKFSKSYFLYQQDKI